MAIELDKTFGKMMEEIGFRGIIRSEAISPKANPELFMKRTYRCRGGQLRVNVLVPKHSYTTSIAYDKRLGLDKVRAYNVRDLLAEIFLNSIERGHRMDYSLPISVKVLNGERGGLIRVQDSGEGFDYRSKFSKMLDGYGCDAWANRWGTGFELLHYMDMFGGRFFTASYEGKGNILNLQVMR